MYVMKHPSYNNINDNIQILYSTSYNVRGAYSKMLSFFCRQKPLHSESLVNIHNCYAKLTVCILSNIVQHSEETFIYICQTISTT